MADRKIVDGETEPAPDTPEPRNRAERRAQQRGKKVGSGSSPAERFSADTHRNQVTGQQRRAGRRGNR